MPKENLKIILTSVLISSFFASTITFAITESNLKEQIQTSVISSSENLHQDLEKNDKEEKENYQTHEEKIVETVATSSPAVVSIIISKDMPILEKYYSSPFFQIPQYRESGETEERQIGGGSGFIVSKDGFIITNRHVVSDENANYTVLTNDGEEFKAEVIAKDPLNDIAVIKIEPDSDLPYLEFTDSDDIQVGQSVIAIGNPLLEFNNSVSVGIISGLSRSITASDRSLRQAEKLSDVIQTDAAINPGNSGGPLLNIEGKVIGVNVAVAEGENIAFSIPANQVSSVFNSIKENGEIIRPFLGIRYTMINERLIELNNLNVEHGVLISRGQTPEELAVIPSSPADKAGLEENDIILEIDGKKLDENTLLAQEIATKEVGEEINLKILSDGEEKEVKVTLEKMEN